MKKTILITIAVAIIVGASAFYGGMKYAASGNPRNGFSPQDFQNLQNLSPEERQQRMEEMGLNNRADNFRGQTGQLGANGARPLSGEILSQTEDGFTIKLPDGSTKIVFTSDSTEITKSTTGSLSDLKTSQQIMVNGAENPDGSFTAKTIQIR
ncbi:MAG: hypothetical protein ABH822_00275 [Patescibacteria group bacterium]